eukprot:881477-Pyramimonas_sp.AAC.1
MSSYMVLWDDVGDGGVTLIDVLAGGEEARAGGARRGDVLRRFSLPAGDAPLTALRTTASQDDRRGQPCARRAASSATISDSVEERDTSLLFAYRLQCET